MLLRKTNGNRMINHRASVQISAFYFVALKIVLGFSFGSSEYFQINFAGAFVFKGLATLFVNCEMSSALEPANHNFKGCLGNVASSESACLGKKLLFHQRDGPWLCKNQMCLDSTRRFPSRIVQLKIRQ